MTCTLTTKENRKVNVQVFPCNEYTIPKFDVVKQSRNKHIKNQKRRYLDCICCFDIETTKVETSDGQISFVWVWQFSINDIVVVGRTLDEFQKFISEFSKVNELSEDKKCIVFVHNLSYEWQFIKKIIPVNHVFAMEERAILKFDTFNGFEFRCSYLLTNFSLKTWAKNEPAIRFEKLEMNYSKRRFPSTKILKKEYKYIVSDVMIMYDGIKEKLKNDTYYTLPLTSTGYVRRHFRRVCKYNKVWQSFLNTQKMNADRFILYNHAFSGGQVRLNPLHYDRIVNNVYSYDISSSYPFQIVSREFPLDRGTFVERWTPALYYASVKRGNLSVAEIKLKNVRLKNFSYAFIQFSSCQYVHQNNVCDNGRIITAKELVITVTSVDFQSLCKFYDFDLVAVGHCVIHKRKGLLPECFRKEVLNLYKQKTQYKGVPEKDIIYRQSKSFINSVYGMTVTCPLRDKITFNKDMLPERERAMIEFANREIIDEDLKKYWKNRNNFLPYSIGVFVTAYARKQLVNCHDELKTDFVYCDTDCNKFVNAEHTVYFHNENKKIFEKLSTLYYIDDFAPRDPKGKRHCIGSWDNETKDGLYTFKGFGSKKYVTEQNGKGHLTIAGCSKNAVKYFTDNGRKITTIKLGEEIPPEYSGRTSAEYIDEPYLYEHGKIRMWIPSCVNINNVSYTLDTTVEHNDFCLYTINEYKLSELYKISKLKIRSEKNAQN